MHIEYQYVQETEYNEHFVHSILGRKIINPSGGYPADIHQMRSADLIRLWPMRVEVSRADQSQLCSREGRAFFYILYYVCIYY